MTATHVRVLVRARKFVAAPANDPWGCSVSVDERLKQVRQMDAAELLTCLNWPSTQHSVKVAIESRLRALRRARK